LKIRLAFISGLLASLLCAQALSQDYRPFPGESVDQRTRIMQERVEAVYASGQFDRALLIYEKELAPLGDKYAQYMVEYMYLNAEGVAQDKVQAAAWYRLAAERGEALLQQTRDELIFEMTVAERQASDRVFLGLWKYMGDRALIMELIRRDMRTLKAQTGSRIPGASANGPAVIFKPSGETVGPNFYRDIRTRLEVRIAYLDARVEINDIVVADELEKIRSAEAAVKNELASIDNP